MPDGGIESFGNSGEILVPVDTQFVPPPTPGCPLFHITRPAPSLSTMEESSLSKMNTNNAPDNPYILLTPGPLSFQPGLHPTERIKLSGVSQGIGACEPF